MRSSRIAAAVGEMLLVAVTVVCLLSIGGAMIVAAPVLVPLHWLAGRDRSGWGAGGWAVLAASAAFQWTWMVAYALTDAGTGSALLGLLAFVVTGAAFLRRAADRYARRLGAPTAV